MIIVKFFSGIGNQLYQYVVYLRLKELYPNQIIEADITTFEDYELLNRGNGFGYGFGLREFFNIEIPVATEEEIKKTSYEVYFGQFSRKYFPGFVKRCVGNSRLARLRALFLRKYRRLRDNYITNIPFDGYTGVIYELDEAKDYYVSGLWQNYEFISPIENELRLKLNLDVEMTEDIRKILTEIQNSNSVCIHVRRGDFISPVYKYSHDLCGSQYYEKALRIIRKCIYNPKFFVFSDDIDYCKKKFSGLKDVTYVSGNMNLSTKEEMFLISKCNSAIISNSTFAFWSVWLSDNPNKVVIAPKYSVREKNNWHMFSVPNHWIIIDNL